MSERDRFSLVGHSALPLMNPLTVDELVRLLSLTGLTPGARVLELGGGRGALAGIAARVFGARVTMVERSAQACLAARATTSELGVEVIEDDLRAFLSGKLLHKDFTLGCAVSSLHAFGDGLEGWTRAYEALRPLASTVLLAEFVALSARAAQVLTLARIEQVSLPARERVLLPAARVLAYERAWCAAVEAHVATRADDPRVQWARERISWSHEPETVQAFRETGYLALVL